MTLQAFSFQLDKYDEIGILQTKEALKNYS